MIPPLIVRRARDLALGIIAVTDHNSAENVAAVTEAARGSDLTVLPGMEVQTKEEVHLLCLFGTVEQALDWQEVIYTHLPAWKNDPQFFGAQFVVDATGALIRHNERLLATSTSLSVEEVAMEVTARGGLCIAAHIDRPSFSLLANLGLVPAGVEFSAMEITSRDTADEMRRRHPSLADYSFICSGDVHRLSEMSDRTILTLKEPTITEISLAFRGQAGRKVKVLAD
jgi:PHP family Zn ribbon phosphoesterase